MLHFFASQSKTEPRTNKPDNVNSGTGTNLRSYLTHPLLISAHKDLELEVGVTHKNLKNNQFLNQSGINNQVSRYNLGDIGINYSVSDDFKGNNLLNIKYLSGLSGSYKNYTIGRSPNKHFNILKISYKRDQAITEDFSIFAHITKVSSDNYLPDPEKAALGGSDIGRAYDNSVLSGNKLFGGFLEARYTNKMEDSSFIENFQPYLFVDAGNISDKNISGTTKTLSSAGLGLRIKFHKSIDLGIEAARPLKRSFLVNGERVSEATKFNIFLNKIFEF
jgi:hemolysin activation/secretion protein